PAQQQALDEILALDPHQFGVALLDGVTGGGKTAVFFEAVADTLRAGRQALILLPEIALTNTFIACFTRPVGTRPAECHSGRTPPPGAGVGPGVLDGSVRAVAGARPALFRPFREPGMVLVAAEHAAGYNRADWATYHARDTAVVRAQLGDPRVILSSATPSV